MLLRKGAEAMESRQKTAGNLAVSEQQRVIVIEATEKPQDLKLRVAAYTRVSSDSADQLNSFAAQNRYYTALISGRENWMAPPSKYWYTPGRLATGMVSTP